MAKEKVTEDYELPAWKGTPGEIAELFDRAFGLAKVIEPDAENLSLSVSLETDGREISFEDGDEFRKYAESGQLSNSVDITAHVSAWHGGVAVMIMLRGRLKAFSGASVSVSGTNHVAVSGLARQLAQQLDKGKRHRISTAWAYLIAIGVALVASVAAGSAASGASSTVKWVVIGAGFLFSLALTGLVSCIPLIVPGLEILDPADPRSRYERWRTKLFAGAGALFLVIVGSVLQAVL